MPNHNMNLDELSYDELVALDHDIGERLKFVDSVQALNEIRSLQLGAKVSFKSTMENQTTL